MADSTPTNHPSTPNTPQEISLDELKDFAELLIRIRQEYSTDEAMKIVDDAVDNLPNRLHTKPFHKSTSYDRYIGRIALYLRANGTDLVHPWSSKKRHTDAQINKRIESCREKEGVWSDPATFPLEQYYWIRDFMADLERCFLVLDETGHPKRNEKGRYVIKSLLTQKPTHTFTVFFWHWTKLNSTLKERFGCIVAGRLLIYNNWSTADFSYELPSGVGIEYKHRDTIWRAEKSYGEENRWQTENFYLSFVSKSGENKLLKQPTGLSMVLAVKHGHPNNTVLEGSFVAADPIYGYPASGRIFLVEDTYLKPMPDMSDVQRDAVDQQRRELLAFARMHVAYQTQTAPIPNGGSFASLDDIPNFSQWHTYGKLFQKPLYGYSLRAVYDEATNKTNPVQLGRFTLKVNHSDSPVLDAPAQITYHDSPGEPVDRGYVTIEQVNPLGLVVYRGEFNYLSDQQRFRYQIQFIRSKAPGSTWYIGTTSGLNRNRTQVLDGRFMVRPTELEPEWLDAGRLADLLFHHEPAMGAFLLETSQEMPTETLPLYRHLKWPHLPRINLPTNELAFNNCAAGEYGCYSMSRKLVGNKSEYNIAFYPVHISKDGYFKIKGGTRKNAEGKDIAIEYEGRAFSAENSSQLHLYVDQADSRTHPFRAGFHFRIKAGDKITSAYGVSERLPQLDEPPQARFEALIALKGNLAYDNTNFRLFDPFSPDDCTELDEQELNLSRFLAGRGSAC